MRRDPEALRRRVLEASVQLVAEQGVRAVSFREVARRAGVSHQTPYHHFGNHIGILRAIAREGFERIAEAMRGAAAIAGPGPCDQLVAAGVAYVGFAREHLGHFRVMSQSALVDSPDAQAPLPGAAICFETIERLSAAAHADGCGTSLSPEALAVFVWSTIHGRAMLVNEGIVAARGTAVDEVATGLGLLLRRDRAPN